MPPRFAYWIKDKTDTQVALAPPARIRAAWPNDPKNGDEGWMVQRHPTGVGALLVFPRYDGAAVTLDAFGEPRDTADGMVYYPSKEAPDREWLIRPESSRPAGEWVKIYDGHLWIPIAFAAPRKLVLCSSGGYREGEPVSEFGQLGHEIFDPFISKEGVPFTDPRLWRLLFLALRESYWVTEEIVEDIPWLTTADITPIAMTALGLNPKRFAAELAGSPSSAPTTPASP